MKTYLETERLYLSNWEATDLPEVAAMNLDPEVMRYFPSTFPKDISQAFIANNIQYIQVHHYGWFKATLKATGDFVGFIGIKDVRFQAEFTPAVEIGWRMVTKMWGNGYATEGAKACLRYAFEELGKEEIVSFTAVPNQPSEAVMQRIGMQKTGEFNHPALEPGHPLERHVLYKITREEWKQLGKGEATM
ncbi:MAG TPA: GNAT family N-acetyltransferase [Cytophagales bacterium]|nr:GNAT family N-acetyltransferase [Cytophagales bacterium]HAA19294.1 GNAT family N-acetyltransferase [Cytophagales bacterium]HAP64826.1 GNAT family N-acetyltransferase [Cytophagales bacterium]